MILIQGSWWNMKSAAVPQIQDCLKYLLPQYFTGQQRATWLLSSQCSEVPDLRVCPLTSTKLPIITPNQANANKLHNRAASHGSSLIMFSSMFHSLRKHDFLMFLRGSSPSSGLWDHSILTRRHRTPLDCRAATKASDDGGEGEEAHVLHPPVCAVIQNGWALLNSSY